MSHPNRSSTLRWAFVLAWAVAIAACPAPNPPGPARRVLSDKVAVKTTAGAATAWVLAERHSNTRQPSGRGSLPGCTITTHSVRHFLVLQIGAKEQRVRFHVSHSGDTTKLPRYTLKPGPQGRCVAVRRAKTQDPWRLVRVRPDGSLFRLPKDRATPDSASPCHNLRPLRAALGQALTDKKAIGYLDKRVLLAYLRDHPSDAALLDAVVTAMIQFSQALNVGYLKKHELTVLQTRVCERPKLLHRLQQSLTDERPGHYSFRRRNVEYFTKRCTAPQTPPRPRP